MLKDTPQGQTNHCPMCEDAAKHIEELERRIAMLVDAIDEIHAGRLKEDCYKGLLSARNATSAQSSAWLNKKHVEWMSSLKPVELNWTCMGVKFNLVSPVNLYAIPSDKD